MNKSLLFLVFIWGCASSILAQKLSLKSDIGVGTFYMTDLKNFQSTSKPDLGVEIESTGKFPPYYGYGISLVNYLQSGFGIGVTVDFYSTGGRNYYEDYSGYYNLELYARAYDIGMVFDIQSFSNERNKVWFEVQTGIKLSTLYVKEELVMPATDLEENNQFVNTSFWMRPGFRYEFSVFKFLSVGAFLGGELNPKGTLHLKQDKEVHIVTSSGNNVKISWTGIRASLSLSFNLNTKKVVVPAN
jgi:hypothetical protein